MSKLNDLYVEIFLNDNHTFSVDVRWVVDQEQHEVWEFDSIQEVNTFLEKFYK